MAMHSLGRIQMAFWVPDILYKKIVASPEDHIRCKMSVVAEASAEVELVCSTTATDMYPNVSLITILMFIYTHTYLFRVGCLSSYKDCTI